MGILLLLGAWWFRAGSGQLPQSQGLPARLPIVHADVLTLNAAEIVERGSPRVLGLRFYRDVELVPHHFSQAGLSDPVPIQTWADHLGAPVVFNAGQFDENMAHLGWLKRHQEWVVPHRHHAWEGLLLSGPVDKAAWARIADLRHAPDSVAERYAHVIQSMMLFDDRNDVRVRDSHKSACRTIVAEDEQGRILVLITEGAVTLSALAKWLMKQPLHLVRAMNLDGGVESQLAIRTSNLHLDFYGQFGTRSGLEARAGMLRYPLPAVIAVQPAPSQTASTRP